MNRVKAAPIYVTMDHLEDGTARGVVANSGNANACCPMSHEYAEEMCAAGRPAPPAAQPPDFVVASTGVIGQTLNIAAIEQGMPAARRAALPAGRLRRGGPRHHDHRHGEEGDCRRLHHRRQDRDHSAPSPRAPA